MTSRQLPSEYKVIVTIPTLLHIEAHTVADGMPLEEWILQLIRLAVAREATS